MLIKLYRLVVSLRTNNNAYLSACIFIQGVENVSGISETSEFLK